MNQEIKIPEFKFIPEGIQEQTQYFLETAFSRVNTLNEGQMVEKLKLIKGLILEEVHELEDAYYANDRKGIINAIVDLNWMVYNYSYYLDINFDEIEDEILKVYKSNMTKYALTEEDAKLSVEMYKNGTHPNKLGEKIECFYFANPNGYYVIMRPDGKILKAHTFLDVDNF